MIIEIIAVQAVILVVVSVVMYTLGYNAGLRRQKGIDEGV